MTREKVIGLVRFDEKTALRTFRQKVKGKDWTGKAVSFVPLAREMYGTVYRTCDWVQALDGRALSTSHADTIYIRTMWQWHDGHPVAMCWQPCMKTTALDSRGQHADAAVEPMYTGRWGDGT